MAATMRVWWLREVAIEAKAEPFDAKITMGLIA